MATKFHAPFLDGFRGYAACMVVYFHAMIITKWQVYDAFRPGLSSVSAFFVLSSFLLTYRTMISYNELQRKHLSKHEHEEKEYFGLHSTISSSTLSCDVEEKTCSFKEKAKFWTRFCVNRVFRIFPLLIVIALATQMHLDIRKSYSDKHPFTAFEVISFVKAPFVFWTLRVEFAYYLFIPVLVILREHCLDGYSKTVRFFKYLLYSLCLAFVVCSPFWKVTGIDGYKEKRLVGHFQTFLMGSLAGLVQYELEKANCSFIIAPPVRLQKWYGFIATSLFLSWSLISSKYYASILSNALPFVSYYDGICHSGLFLAPMILLAHWSQHHCIFNRFMSNSYLRFYGKISFSLYLLHPIVLFLMYRRWQVPQMIAKMTGYSQLYQSSLDTFFISFILATALSLLTFKLVEEPFMQMTKTICKKYL